MQRLHLAPDPGAVGRLRSLLLDNCSEFESIVSDFVTEIWQASLATPPGTYPDPTLTRLARDWIVSVTSGTDAPATDAGSIFGALESALPSDVELGQWLSAIFDLKRRLLQRVLVASVGADATMGMVDAIEIGFGREVVRLATCRAAVVSRGDDADARVAEVLQVLVSIGHELRNPLSTIETSTYLISQRLSTHEDTSVKKHLDKIRNQVRFSSQIVGTLLDLARQRSSKRAQVGLRELLESAIEARPVQSNVSVHLEVPRDLMIFADPAQIQMIVENLLSNANDALSGLDAHNIAIVATVSGEDLDICVKDDGPGIPEDAKSRIFEVAFTTKAGGHGLGLPLCRRLAESHGGTLTLEPSSGGCTFRLHLPLAVRHTSER